MVSIIERSKYLDQIHQQPKLHAFWLLIAGEKSIPNFSNNNDDGPEDQMYQGMIRALMCDDRSEFEKFYHERSKGKPISASTAPYIHVDFLVFTIVLGLTKYKLELDWISHILKLRSKNELTKTFENLLSKNYFSHDNVPEVVFIFLSRIQPDLIDQTFATRVFQTLNQKKDIDSMKNDFQKMCILRSYDSIIELKTIPEGGEILNLRKFESHFLKRTLIVSWCLQIVFLIIVVVGIQKASDQLATWINEHSAFFTGLGVIGLSVVNFVPSTREFFHRVTALLLGYPKEYWNQKQRKVR
jgi:hypothetical protein